MDVALAAVAFIVVGLFGGGLAAIVLASLGM